MQYRLSHNNGVYKCACFGSIFPSLTFVVIVLDSTGGCQFGFENYWRKILQLALSVEGKVSRSSSG